MRVCICMCAHAVKMLLPLHEMIISRTSLEKTGNSKFIERMMISMCVHARVVHAVKMMLIPLHEKIISRTSLEKTGNSNAWFHLGSRERMMISMSVCMRVHVCGARACAL